MSVFKTLHMSDHILTGEEKSAGSINHEKKCTLSSLDFILVLQKKVTVK